MLGLPRVPFIYEYHSLLASTLSTLRWIAPLSFWRNYSKCINFHIFESNFREKNVSQRWCSCVFSLHMLVPEKYSCRKCFHQEVFASRHFFQKKDVQSMTFIITEGFASWFWKKKKKLASGAFYTQIPFTSWFYKKFNILMHFTSERNIYFNKYFAKKCSFNSWHIIWKCSSTLKSVFIGLIGRYHLRSVENFPFLVINDFCSNYKYVCIENIARLPLRFFFSILKSLLVRIWIRNLINFFQLLLLYQLLNSEKNGRRTSGNR